MSIQNITNPELIGLIQLLRKKSRENQAKIWDDVSDKLLRSKQRRTKLNISRLNRFTKKGETIVVPGKVLGSGRIDHNLIVAAFAFSELAKSKISNARGKCLKIADLIDKNPKGTGVKILG